MKKIFKIFIFIIIFIMLFTLSVFALIKLIKNSSVEQTQKNIHNNGISNTLVQFNNDPIRYDYQNENIKGLVSNVNYNGAIITITNNYYFDESFGNSKQPNRLDEYNSLSIHLTENVHILDYEETSEIKFEDIKVNDILIYEGNIEYINEKERRIDSGNIFILKNSDLQKITLEQYKDVSQFKDIKIVFEYEPSDLQNTKILYGKLNVKTIKGDQLVTFIKMQISADTIVENSNTNDIADIILKNSFEITTQNKSKHGDKENNIHEIKKIIYK